MLKQTGGEWSAPLDDVFIHFDYARATALGHPFEWTIGNGYSSGNTSLTYPFVLAIGWLAGFTGRDLMKWAAIVAAMCVFGTLLAARRIFIEHARDGWGRLSSYLLPPVFLGVGALVWSLWSGMEVAFFLATWAVAFVAWTDLEAGVDRARGPRGWALGLSGALLVATRPEAAFTIAVFGAAAASRFLRWGRREAFFVLVRAGAPAVAALALQAIANRVLTGEWSANGAIVKLAINNPFMTGEEKLADWIFNARYAVLRNLDYHFAEVTGDHLGEIVAYKAWWAGVVPFALALLPLCFGRTRRIAIVLWLQIAGWIAIVALNGQVRWQNERYVMPAVAWMLILTALGVSVSFRARARPAHLRTGTPPSAARLRPGLVATVLSGALVVQTIAVLIRPPGEMPSFRASWLLAFACGAAAYAVLRLRPARIVLAIVAVLFAYDHQIPKMRDQKWFFGRASRNIRDQHLTLGKYLAEIKPRRVLVGDAGAILYESNRPGLDIIGLGGYAGLPFARAGVHGLPATLELIERIPDSDRPDVLAIFPTWWGVLPLWFGGDVMRRFPVEGNVICGGYEHVVYEADWRLLDTGERMRWMPPKDEQLRVIVDVADLVSEKANRYAFARPQNGWTEMRILPDPVDARHDMFDAGRRIGVGRWEAFDATELVFGRDAHLVVRTAQEKPAHVRVRVDGVEVAAFDFVANGAWNEDAVTIPAAHVRRKVRIELVNDGPGDFVDYHVWITQ